MLKIHLVPVDGEPVDLDLEHTRLSNREAKQVETYTGMRAIVFQAGMAVLRDIDPETGDFKPGQAPVVLASEYSDADHLDVMIWLALRRSGQPELKLADIPEYDTLATTVEVIDDPTDGPVPDPDPTPPATTPEAAPEPNPAGESTG